MEGRIGCEQIGPYGRLREIVMVEESGSDPWVKRAIGAVAVAMSLYHFVAARFVLLPFDLHKVIHIGLALILTLLGFYAKRRSTGLRTIDGVLIFISVGASLYFILDYDNIVMRVGYPYLLDFTMGGIIVLITLEVNRRVWGKLITAITLLTMLYAYFGSYLPGIFFHGGIRIPRLIAYSSSYYRGVYGSLAGVSSMEVFLYILFGSMLKAAGAVDFFMEVGKVFARRFRSGPAQTAVVSSGLFGTISGSIAANVATTGAFTIPAMIKRGFSKEYAGAVEATASSGGQIMPPVMGVAAFMMAGIIGMPYAYICLAAALPAVLYYIFLGVSIEIQAIKKNMPRETVALTGTKEAAKKHAYLVLPLIVLVYSLSLRNPAATGAFHAIVALIIAFTVRWALYYGRDFRKTAKEIYRFLFEGLSDGGISGAQIAVVMATLGIVVEMFVVTGFGQKLSQGMVEISEGSLFILLIMSMITCIFFGMLMPTTAAYLLTVLLAAPAMVSLGVNVLNAHMFVFYFGVMAAVTPPVAIGALVASGIAKGDYFKTAFIAWRLALPGFLLPFFFIYRPEILWLGHSPIKIFLGFVFILIGLLCLTIAFENFLLRKLRIYERLLLICAALLEFEPGLGTSILGTIIFFAIYYFQWKSRRRTQNSVEFTPLSADGT